MTRQIKRFGMALCAFILLTGCARLGAVLANIPVTFGDVEIHKDLPYGDDPVQSLNVYIPKDAGTAPLPVLVFFHGGRWQEGDKDTYGFVGARFAEKGIIVVILGYRKYPGVEFPAFVEDGARALSWVKKNIGSYGGQDQAVFLSGHSSGAHIAALLAADESHLEAAGFRSGFIAAFAGLAGPYDFVPEAEDLKAIFGPPEQYPKMQVPTFIDGNEPPMLLLHGREDKTVVLRNLRRLRTAINKAGGVVETRIYEGVDHIEIVGAMSWLWDHKAPVAADIYAFFTEHPGPLTFGDSGNTESGNNISGSSDLEKKTETEKGDTK